LIPCRRHNSLVCAPVSDSAKIAMICSSVNLLFRMTPPASRSPIIAGSGSGDQLIPSLWNHNATRERQLVVEPDSHCQIRDLQGRVPERLEERAQERWATASRSHYNRDLQFNSQSLIVATTERPSLGGRAWPSVVFPDD